MSIEDFIIWLYCCVDDYIKEIPQATKLRSRGFSPSLDDAEVITLELAGEFLGIDTDKGIWGYFHQHWKALFPSLGSRSNFAKQASNLLQLKQLIQEKALSASGSSDEDLHIIDGFPIPICHFRRARGCKIFREVEQATYGFCASKQERYSGFEGHIVITNTGMITGFTLTKPNIEREASFECTNTIEGLLLGDKGYTGENYSEELKLEGIQISTPSKKNGEDKETPAFRNYLNNTRRRVETVIGQLVDRFSIAKVWARDVWHLNTRIIRKVLSHTLAIILLRENNRGLMALDKILASNHRANAR